MSKVNALVLTGFGLNCDRETAHAFELAGASSHCVHINALIGGSVRLEDHHILVFIGGFGWGDDHGAGVVQAVRFKTNLGDRILEFVDRGRLVLGICNGFQALVNLGLLPGFDGDYRSRSVALTHNECGNFRNQWVRLNVDRDSPCIFTRGIQGADLASFDGCSMTTRSSCAMRLPTGLPPRDDFPITPMAPWTTSPGYATPPGAFSA